MGPKKSKLKTALVLSGGGPKGAAQIGALKVILKKITPDVIIGTSIGAANGGLVALGVSLETIERYWLDVKKEDVCKFNLKILYQLHLCDAIYSHRGLHKRFQSFFNGYHFADCKIPLYINTTRLKDGANIVFHEGLILDAVLASCSLPPIYPPYKIKGVKYMDGGLTEFVNTETALALKCKQIIIVNVGYTGHPDRFDKGMLRLSHHAIELLAFQSLRKEIEECKHDNVVEVKCDIDSYNMDFSKIPYFIEQGEIEAKKVLRKIIV